MPNDIDAEFITKQHEFASGLYGDAITRSEEVEELFKSDYKIPRDQGDSATAGGPTALKPARARAILEKNLTLMSVRAQQKLAVIAKDSGPEEQEKCSKIERWMSGYQRKHMMETKGNPWRDMVYWYLLRGRGVLETRFDPSYLKTDCLPIRTFAPDPNGVFAVRGENGIGFYTKEYTRYVWDVRAEMTKRRGTRAKWNAVTLPDKDKDNDTLSVVEYWDDKYCGATLEGELLYVRKHDYGFVPLAEARCMETPLASMEWAYQSVLSPIMDSLKQIYILASKMAAGVDMFYWPTILVTTPMGVFAYDGGTIRAAEIPTGATKVDIINPTPNAQVLGQLMGWLNGDVQLGSLPDIAWGAEPSSLESGFAISQVLSQVQDKIWQNKTNLEVAMGWDWGHKLRLVEKFGRATGAALRVPVESKMEYGY